MTQKQCETAALAARLRMHKGAPFRTDYIYMSGKVVFRLCLRKKLATGLESNMTWLNKKLKADQNFDVVYRVIHVGGKMPAFTSSTAFARMN